MTDRIQRWHPFLYRYMSYDGTKRTYTFTCNVCGGHNCEKIDSLDRYCFWSGYYRCTDCGNEKGKDGQPICYYSDNFKGSEQKEPEQLSLF